MPQNIIEYTREMAVGKLFQNSFYSYWQSWKNEIRTNCLSPQPTERQLYDLGDHLRDIFRSTGQTGRAQEELSSGGANWEALVCWYLNLCLVGRRTIVIKHNKALLPQPVEHAITVNYGNFKSNTESDLIAITFPDKNDYSIDKNDISVLDPNGNHVRVQTGRKYRLLPVLDALVARDFAEIEIHIIQCKTNWNDNAQIPMLWDAVYQADNFRNGVSVGTNGFSIHDVRRFTYSFVTVPSNQLIKNGRPAFQNTSTAVLRVRNLSGGNYWGIPSEDGVASSIKELIERNLKSGHRSGILATIRSALPEYGTTYNYFDLI